MFHLSTILCLLLLASCAAPLPPVAVPVPAPRPTAAVAPLVATVRQDAAKTAAVAAKLEGQVGSLRELSGSLSDGLNTAMAEVEKLRIAKTATETELESVWQLLTASNTQARNLFAEVEKTKALADEHQDARRMADERLVELATAAVARDAETLALRDQRDHYAAELAKAGIVHASLLEKLAKEKSKAAVGTYLKGIAAFLILIAVAIVALKIFKPF